MSTMFKIDVPFYDQTKEYTCGPTALKMAATFLGKDCELKEISKLCHQLDSGMTLCQGVVLAADSLGFRVEYYSKSPKSVDITMPFFKKAMTDNSLTLFHQMLKLIEKKQIPIYSRSLSLNALLEKIGEDSVPLVTLNVGILRGSKDFMGHYVPVVGYDKDNVYVHNFGESRGISRAFFPIAKKNFVEAWSDKGADRNTIIIYRR